MSTKFNYATKEVNFWNENDLTLERAGSILIDCDNNVLLVKQSNGIWSFPKGSLHIGETNYEAARRETIEECGIDIAAYEYNSFHSVVFNGCTYTMYVYKLPVSFKELDVKTCEETTDYMWKKIGYVNRHIRMNNMTFIYLKDGNFEGCTAEMEKKKSPFASTRRKYYVHKK